MPCSCSLACVTFRRLFSSSCFRRAIGSLFLKVINTPETNANRFPYAHLWLSVTRGKTRPCLSPDICLRKRALVVISQPRGLVKASFPCSSRCEFSEAEVYGLVVSLRPWGTDTTRSIMRKPFRKCSCLFSRIEVCSKAREKDIVPDSLVPWRVEQAREYGSRHL